MSYYIAISVLVLSIGGLLVFTAASIWVIVIAFRIGIAWGIACLIFPPASIPFTVIYWQEVKAPTLLGIAGLCVVFLAVLILLCSGALTLEELQMQMRLIRDIEALL